MNAGDDVMLVVDDDVDVPAAVAGNLPATVRVLQRDGVPEVAL